MIVTSYRIEDIEDYDNFLNNLVKGLSYYKRKNIDFTFRLEYDKDLIILKTMKLNESAN